MRKMLEKALTKGKDPIIVDGDGDEWELRPNGKYTLTAGGKGAISAQQVEKNYGRKR